MDLTLDETQQMLKNTAKDFFATECTETHVREMENDSDGYSKQLWEKIVNQGWLGVPFSEKYGGFGLSFLEFCILLEEAGRVLLPEPLFHTVILGGMPINIAGNDKQKEELLPKIISGESIATLAFHEEDDSIMESYLDGNEPSIEQIKQCIRKGTIKGSFVPVLTGSAFKNKGVQPLLDAVIDYMPSPKDVESVKGTDVKDCLLYTSPSPRDGLLSRMPSSA